MPPQAKNNQVEPDPLERLLEVAQAIPDRQERLLVKSAEAGQIREVDPASKGKHRLKQLVQKLALPKANGAVVNVSHFPENSGHHRRE